MVYLKCGVKHMKKDNNEKLDIKRLNDIIKTGRNILKFSWAFMLVGVVLLFTFLIKEWKLLEFLSAIIKIISPLFIGLIVAWLLDSIVTWLQKNGVKRSLATVLVFLGFLSIIILFLVIMIPALASQVNEFISYAPNILEYVKNTGENVFNKLALLYNYDFTSVKEHIYLTITNLISSVTIGLPNIVINLASSIISGGLNIILGLFVAFYMLFDFNNLRKHMLSLLPKKIHGDAITLTDKLNKTLRNYVQGILLIMLILFIFQSITLGFVGLSSPMLFGLFCAITNVIPYVGPYIGGIPAVIVGFTISPMTGIGCLIAIVVAQLLESNFLEPVVMSKTMKLHPVTIMLGLLIFGHFFGILGMILATPTISCLKCVFEFFNEKYDLIGNFNKNVDEEK